jgi:hypothetical protein
VCIFTVQTSGILTISECLINLLSGWYSLYSSRTSQISLVAWNLDFYCGKLSWIAGHDNRAMGALRIDDSVRAADRRRRGDYSRRWNGIWRRRPASSWGGQATMLDHLSRVTERERKPRWTCWTVNQIPLSHYWHMQHEQELCSSWGWRLCASQFGKTVANHACGLMGLQLYRVSHLGNKTKQKKTRRRV